SHDENLRAGLRRTLHEVEGKLPADIEAARQLTELVSRLRISLREICQHDRFEIGINSEAEHLGSAWHTPLCEKRRRTDRLHLSPLQGADRPLAPLVRLGGLSRLTVRNCEYQRPDSLLVVV